VTEARQEAVRNLRYFRRALKHGQCGDAGAWLGKALRHHAFEHRDVVRLRRALGRCRWSRELGRARRLRGAL